MRPDVGLLQTFLGFWLAITFAWWHQLRPPAVPLARLYMAIGAFSTVAHLVLSLVYLDPHALWAELLGGFVIVVALYAEVFLRWLSVRTAPAEPACARIVGTTRSRRRFPAGP